MAKSVEETMDLVSAFLGEIRKEAAAPTGPDEEQPGAASNTETEDIKKLESESDGITDSQTNLGKEQASAAAAGGANADVAPENTDADGTDPVDGDEPKKLDIDQPAKENSDVLGGVKKQEINMEQKLARAEGLANAILEVIEDAFTKKAAEASAEEEVSEEKEASDEEGNAKKSLEDLVLEKMAAKAQEYAQDQYESYLLGMQTRLRDEMELKEAELNPEVLDKFGGVEGLLDKVAAENPEAVLPPELMGEAPVEAPVEEAPVEEAPVEEEAVAPEMGGEVSEAELDELATALDEAGVTPEDLEQAFSDIQALEEAGVQPEELAQAIEEMSAEGAPMPEEAPVEEAPVEEAPVEEEKVACDRQKIDYIKEFLRR
jgi:hypothetical protein